jgi:hypothetical protein
MAHQIPTLEEELTFQDREITNENITSRSPNT